MLARAFSSSESRYSGDVSSPPWSAKPSASESDSDSEEGDDEDEPDDADNGDEEPVISAESNEL
jgi:hypothetical protein